MVNSIILSGVAWASSLKDAIVSQLKEERGQDLIEYAVLAGAIGMAAAIAFIAGPNFQDIAARFADKVGGCITLDGATCY